MSTPSGRPSIPARPANYNNAAASSSSSAVTPTPLHVANGSNGNGASAVVVQHHLQQPSMSLHKEDYSQPQQQMSHAARVALWEEVGLCWGPNGSHHNYDPSVLSLDSSELHALHDEFLAHRKLFGFQQDNVRNQMEHLCFLIQNARDRYGTNAYQYLHNRFFSNYRRWCSHINAQRWCFQRRMKHAFDSPSYGDRNKIQDLVLWLLIWGEAANLRHCPEYLCFIFYRMSMERQRVIDSGVIDRDHMEDEWFRCHVIEPAYNIAFAMQQYMRNNGTLKDHEKRPNYDDLNEYFWNRRWLDHNKNYHDEDREKFWGLKYNRNGMLIELDQKTGKVIVQKEGKPAEAKMRDASRITLKTFPEKRSWLNLFRSFFRIVELHFFALHVLLLFGYGYVQKRDWDTCATAALTPAGLAIILEVVEFLFYWGVIYSQGLLMNFLLRLVVYAGIFLIMFYLWFTNFTYWVHVAIIYLALRILWEFINVNTHRWIRKWHMSEDRNFESQVATQLGVWRRIGSTIFWFVIFIAKCFYSYYTYIKPIILITSTLLSIPGWVGQAGIGPDNKSSLSNWLLIVLLWLPTIIMFLLDTQIFFSSSIVILGLILGVRDRVCNIRSWDDIEKSFTESWRNGARKFFGRDNAIQIGVDAQASIHMKNGILNLPPLISPPWHLIQVMWSEIVGEMRAADHTSYHDDQLLQFGHFTFLNELKEVQETFFLPPFVTAGQVGSFVEMLGELQDAKERRLGGMSMILNEIKNQLKTNETMRTALDEIYTAGTLLLQTFIPHGPVHFDLGSGNKLLEYTCRQKKPFTFLKDIMKCLENTVLECIAICFDNGHIDIIRRPPTLANITSAQTERTEAGEQVKLKLPVESLNTKSFESGLQQLYKFWIMIAEGSGPGLDHPGPANAPDKNTSGAQIASNVAPQKVDLSAIQNMHQNELASLLRTIYHLLSTPNVDARPSSRTVSDRLMFFLSSLNTRMPERQNSVKEMYSWTVLTPYVEELVIYTPEELELPNAEGITADFYLKSVFRKEWMNFLERLANDPQGTDPNYRLVQKREWCSFRGQTLLRTVRGMMYYEKAVKILALLELSKGSHWTHEQEVVAQQIAQRKFQYCLSCQKFGAFKSAREKRDRGELLDKANLPETVRLERKRLLDEAQKADDIEYILRKYPHLRIAYVDDTMKDGVKVFASVLVKAASQHPVGMMGHQLLPNQGMTHIPGTGQVVLAGSAAGKQSRRDALIARARAEQLRQEELAGNGNIGSNQRSSEVERGGEDIGNGMLVEDIEADKGSFTAHALKGEVDPTLGSGTVAGYTSSDIQEVYRVRLPGAIMIGEGKPENQNHAMIFTRGEFLEAIDMNQDNYLEEAFKMRNLLEEFDPLRTPDTKVHRDELQRPSPVTHSSNDKKAQANGMMKCAILGFRENIFTANLMSVGTYMSLMEATFVSITLRTFAWLGSRMHYGHPDCMDKLFFITRGGMSKSSKMIHVSEDIFAGFKSTLRGGRILHKEYIQCGKGRDLGFNQLFLFEAKLASGAGEQALSREAYRLGRYLDLPRLLSFFYGSIGFYTTTALIIVSIAALLFSRMMIALTGVDRRINEFNHDFGVSVSLLHASSIYQLGLLLILPMLAEIALEKTFIKAITTYIWMLVTGAPFFFFFHTQTKAFFFNNSIMYGGAKYRATGRGFVLNRDGFTRTYRTYARSHIYPAMKFLFMMTVFGIFDRSGLNWFIEMWAPLLLVIAWLYSPMWFCPMAFDHDKVLSDFSEWRQWLDRKSMKEEESWQGWWIMETEYLNRTPLSTKFWLVLFNTVIPILIIAAAISSLEASSISRVYFLLISVGITVGLVIVSLFLIYQFHPVGESYRWLKFIIGSLIFALLLVTIIFDTGSASFGWKGTNFIVYIIVIMLTFNSICKVLVILGAGPYRFGFCLTWFRYCDTIFGMIVYAPWLIFSFIGLASIQTRLLYNRTFFRGLRVSELLRGDPERRDKVKEKNAVMNKKLGPGFTPAMQRDASFEDLKSGVNREIGGGGGGGDGGNNGGGYRRGRFSVPSSRNYSHASNPSTPTGSAPGSMNSSRRGSADDGVEMAERTGLLRGQDVASGANSQQNMLIYSHSPSAASSSGTPVVPAPLPTTTTRPTPSHLVVPTPTQHSNVPPPIAARPPPIYTTTPSYRPSISSAAASTRAEEEKSTAAAAAANAQPRYTYD